MPKPMADFAFDVRPFDNNVAVFHDVSEMVRYHEKVLGAKDHGIDPTYAKAMACSISGKDGAMYFSMYLPEDAPLSQIVHECSHMVDFLFKHHGVGLDVCHTEIRAYMLQRMFEDVTKMMNVVKADV